MTAIEKLLDFTFTAKAENLSTLRSKVRDSLAVSGYGEDTINCAVLALGEACMNIIQHAYGDGETGDIVVEIERKGHHLVFRLTDFAKHKSSLDEMKSRRLDDIRPGGLGCHIINEIMDEVEMLDCVHKNGNVLQLKKNTAAGEPSQDPDGN